MGSFPNITDFSNELLCQILKYLPLREILSVAMLCRKMAVAVDMHLTLCKSIDFCQDDICGYMPSTITDDHLLILLKKCPHLETVYGLHPVKIERRRLRKRSALTIPGIIEALSLCFHLKAIETSDLRLLEAIMQHLPHIEIIGHFQNRDGIFPPQASQRLKLQPYPRISSLHLIGVEVPELTAMPHLQHLHLQCVRFTKLQPFRAFLAQNLKSFVMKHCIGPSVPQRYLSLIIALSSSPNLNHLELVRVPLLNGLFQRAVEDSYRHDGFVNLRTLVISGCKGILEADLGHLMIISSKNLETLYIQPSLTKDSLFVSLSYAQCSFPKLQNLHLGYIETLNVSGEWSNDTLLSFGLAEIPDTPSSITDSGMKVISVLFPRIKTLSVSNCPHLMVMYHWMSPEDDEAWSRLTDLTLQKCHCLQLSSFAVFVAFLANIEVVILNDMFREPPKGCSHVGLSAGTGLGMSSAVVSNQDEHIAVQGHHQDFEHPGDEENEENEREFIDVENEEPHFMVLQRDFFDGEEEEDENGAAAAQDPAAEGQELNDDRYFVLDQNNELYDIRQIKAILICDDLDEEELSQSSPQKEKESKNNFKEPSDKSPSPAKSYGQSDPQIDLSCDASLKNAKKNEPGSSLKSNDFKGCSCSKSTNCDLYSDYDPHKPSTSKAGRHLDYSNSSNDKSCNACDFEDDHFTSSKRSKKISNEQNVLKPKRENIDLSSGSNYYGPCKGLKDDESCSTISDSEKKINSLPDKNLKYENKKIVEGNPEGRVSRNRTKNLNSVSYHQMNSNSQNLKSSLRSYHSVKQDNLSNLKESKVDKFTSSDINVPSTSCKIKKIKTDEISDSLENNIKSSDKKIENTAGEFNSPKNGNVPKNTICRVSCKKLEDENPCLAIKLKCEHSGKEGCSNSDKNVTSAEINESNLVSLNCDVPMNTKDNKKTKNNTPEKTRITRRHKIKEPQEASEFFGEGSLKHEENNSNDCEMLQSAVTNVGKIDEKTKNPNIEKTRITRRHKIKEPQEASEMFGEGSSIKEEKNSNDCEMPQSAVTNTDKSDKKAKIPNTEKTRITRRHKIKEPQEASEMFREGSSKHEEKSSNDCEMLQFAVTNVEKSDKKTKIPNTEKTRITRRHKVKEPQEVSEMFGKGSSKHEEKNSNDCEMLESAVTNAGKSDKKTENPNTEKIRIAQRQKRKEPQEASEMFGEGSSKQEEKDSNDCERLESVVTNAEKVDKNNFFEKSKHTNKVKYVRKRQFKDRISSSPGSISNNTRSNESKMHDLSQPSTSKDNQNCKKYTEELPRSVRSKSSSMSSKNATLHFRTKNCDEPSSSLIESSVPETENTKSNVKVKYKCDSDAEFPSPPKKFKGCLQNSSEEDHDLKYFILKSDTCVEIINSLTGESHKIAACRVNITKLEDENAKVHTLKSYRENNPERLSNASYEEEYCDYHSSTASRQENNFNCSSGSSSLISVQKYSASKKRSKRTHSMEIKEEGKHISKFLDNTGEKKNGSCRDCNNINVNSPNIPSSSKVDIEKLKISNSDASIVINFTEGINSRLNHIETTQTKKATAGKKSENGSHLIKKFKTESESERGGLSKPYPDAKNAKISDGSEKNYSPASKKTRKKRILSPPKSGKKKKKSSTKPQTSSKHTRYHTKKTAAVPIVYLVSQGSQANSADIRRCVRRIRRATARARSSVSSAYLSRSSVHSSKISSRMVIKKPINLNPRPETHDKATSTSDPLLEDDAVQTLQLTSKTLLSFTVVSCGISDIIIDHCPKLFHIEVQACRILKNFHLNYCPAMKRLNISQCPKLSICALASSIMSTDTNSYFLISYEPCMQGYHPGDGEKAVLSRTALNQSVLLCHDFNNLSHEGIQAIFKEKLLEWFNYLFKMNKIVKLKSRNMKKKNEKPDSSDYPYHHDLRKMYGSYAYSPSNGFCHSEGQYQLVTNNPVFCDIFETRQLHTGFPSIYDCDAVKNISLISFEAREKSFKMENNFIGFYIPITENNQTNF